MATTKGKEGVVRVGTAPTTILGELRSFEVTISTNEVDTSTMGTDWTGVDGTQKSWSAQATMWFDPDDLGQTQLEVGEKIEVEFFPGGETSGLLVQRGTAMLQEVSRPQSFDNIIEFNASFVGDGELTTETVA